MTRYIDADVLLLDLTYQKATFESVQGGRSGLFAKGVACGLDGAIQSVKNAEAEDVSPVKHGKWVEYVDDRWGASYYSCSECGKPPLKEERTNRQCLSNFCPNCGARMEE